MGDPAVEVIVTPGFRQRLLEIATYLDEADAGFAFDRLLDDLEAQVIPNLRRFPRLGRSYARRAFLSAEAKAQLAGLAAAKVGRLREYLHGDYLVLYAVDETAQAVQLLSIRHHRQLSFDFHGLWQGT